MPPTTPSLEVVAALDLASRELSLFADGKGVVKWASPRAVRMGLTAGVRLDALVVPGCEDNAAELCRRGCVEVVTGWELPLVIDGTPATAVFGARPCEGGAALVGNLVAQDYADQRKDEFLAMLAHELRNPLAAIRTGLPLLDRYPPHDDVEARTRDVMKRQAGLLTQLVDDLLDVSRVTRNRIVLQQRRIDLAALVSEVCDGLRVRVVTPRRQTLMVARPEGAVWVDGDPGRLEQVLTNLVDNASKYSDDATTIELTLTVTGKSARVAVKDRGVGLDAATLPLVFDLFAQATTSLDRSRGGLGIGLTLVKALVEMHGGAVGAASEGLGKGTTFSVTLPLAASPVAVVAPVAVPAAEAGRVVLLVDDNADGREMLRCLCELQGHDVAEAGDGEEGVARALERPFDIAFVDIGLPTIDGYEVARRVRARLGTATPRLVALSGYGSDEHRARAAQAGFDAHIAKPIELAQLNREIALAPRR